MRREDRELRRNSSQPGSDKERTREPQRPSEQDKVKGGHTSDEPQSKPTPERHGRLPLPD